MQLTVCFVSFICLSYSAVKRFFFFSLTLLRTQFSTRHWSTTLQYEYTKVAIINIIRIKWKLQEFNEKKDHDQSTFFPFIVWILSFWLVVSTWLFSALYTVNQFTSIFANLLIMKILEFLLTCVGHIFGKLNCKIWWL